jgi:hypothetical protein
MGQAEAQAGVERLPIPGTPSATFWDEDHKIDFTMSTTLCRYSHYYFMIKMGIKFYVDQTPVAGNSAFSQKITVMRYNELLQKIEPPLFDSFPDLKVLVESQKLPQDFEPDADHDKAVDFPLLPVSPTAIDESKVQISITQYSLAQNGILTYPDENVWFRYAEDDEFISTDPLAFSGTVGNYPQTLTMNCLPGNYFEESTHKCAAVPDPIPDCFIYSDKSTCSVCKTGFKVLVQEDQKKICVDPANLPNSGEGYGFMIPGSPEFYHYCGSARCKLCANLFTQCTACKNEFSQELVNQNNGDITCEFTEVDDNLDDENIVSGVPGANLRTVGNNEFRITEAYFRDSTQHVKLKFSARCNPNLDFRTINVKLFEKDLSTEVSVIYQKAEFVENERILELTLKFQDNIENGFIEVEFTNPLLVYEANKPQNQITKDKWIVSNVNFYKSKVEEVITGALKSSNVGLQALSVLYYIISSTSALILVKLFQMIDYLMYFNVDHPSNLYSFLGYMSKGPIDNLPNFFSFLTDGNCNEVKDRFSDQGLNCQILESYGNYFLVVFFLILFKLAVTLAYHLLDYWNKDPLWLRKLHHNWMGSRFWLEFFDAIQLDLYINAIISFTSYKGGTKIANTNLFISIGLVALALSGIIFLFFKARYYNQLAEYKELPLEKLEELFDKR